MEYPPQFPHQIFEQQKDDQHLKLLAIFHFVVGGLAFFGMGILGLNYLILSRMMTDPKLLRMMTDPKLLSSAPTPMNPNEMLQTMMVFYAVIGGLLLLASVTNILSGIFIQRRKHRIFSMTVAGLNCLQIPLGTVLGVFTIVVLGKDSVRRAYGEV